MEKKKEKRRRRIVYENAGVNLALFAGDEGGEGLIMGPNYFPTSVSLIRGMAGILQEI